MNFEPGIDINQKRSILETIQYLERNLNNTFLRAVDKDHVKEAIKGLKTALAYGATN